MQQDISISKDQHEHHLPAKVVGIFLLGLLLLAMFQSAALLTLTYDLGPGALNEKIIWMAEGWHGWMQVVGTAEFTEMLGDFIQSWHDTPVA